MRTKISNGLVTAQIDHTGAELKSLYHHGHQIEYMWQADPKFWGKTSPVLFPIVGALKEGSYTFDGKSYSLPRHGFARDKAFELVEASPSRAVFSLKSSEETKAVFPFDFDLRIAYELDAFSLNVTYSVNNVGSDQLWFSLGAHPAFRVPLADGSSYEDHFLAFNEAEDLNRWPITKDGLIEMNPVNIGSSVKELPITRELFNQDALVFKNLKSTAIAIRSHKHTHGVEFLFKGFPFFGIWAAPNADFVCLEPWCGIADSTFHNQQLTSKEGIQHLEAGGTWTRTWSVKCF